MDATVSVRLATPADAKEIARLVDLEFGARYADRWLRCPDDVAAALSAGDVTFAVAHDEAGQHVAQLALERRGRWTYEHGRGVVLPAWRRHGLLDDLGGVLFRELARTDAQFVFGRSVTNHVATQRYTKGLGFSPMGLLLGAWPPTCHGEGRVSALFTGRFTRVPTRPRRLALEGADLALASELLAGLGVTVTRQPARVGPRLGFTSTITTGHELVAVHVLVGPGLPRPLIELTDALTRAADEGATYVWVDVPSQHPAAAGVVEQARAAGCSFGAYLPLAGSDGRDVLRLQRYLGPGLSERELHVIDDAQRLRAAVLADAAQTGLLVHV